VRGAMRAVRPGGYVFIGDVRSLGLAEAFHVSVEVARARATATRDDIRERARRRLRREQELLIEPAFFERLADQHGRAASVEVQLKRGCASNELTRFRYDVVIEVGAEHGALCQADEILWRDVGSVAALAEMIRQHPAGLIVRGVPNARLQESWNALAWAAGGDGPRTVGEWRTLNDSAATDAVEPEAIWRLEKAARCDVHIGWSGPTSQAAVDVVLRPRTKEASPVISGWQHLGSGSSAFTALTNEPQRNNAPRRLLATLRQYLRAQLPEHMVPPFIELLDALPLNPNGKVDRRRLPVPANERHAGESGFDMPRTPLERDIATVWQEVLGLDRVGVHDNFFDLGGHSLLLVRAHARLCETLNAGLIVTDLFRYPTISALASFIGLGGDAQPLDLVDARAGKQRNTMNRRAHSGVKTGRPQVAAENSDAVTSPIVMHSRVHPAQLRRIRRADWKLITEG
jgi:hypothetical protein